MCENYQHRDLEKNLCSKRLKGTYFPTEEQDSAAWKLVFKNDKWQDQISHQSEKVKVNSHQTESERKDCSFKIALSRLALMSTRKNRKNDMFPRPILDMVPVHKREGFKHDSPSREQKNLFFEN